MDDDWTHNFRAIYFAKLEIEEIDRAEEKGDDRAFFHEPPCG